MKFGGAAVQEAKRFSQIALLIQEKRKEFQEIVVVVSAMGKSTDQLIDLAYQVSKTPSQREMDMLISVGERISISLLAMALSDIGCPAVSFTGSQSGIITTNDHSEALIIDMRPLRIVESLEQGKVVIVAGFQGVSKKKEITTLGRGGSDTTAVALGVALGAERVEFYKDVDGIYNIDPKKDSTAVHYPKLSFEEALTIVRGGAKVLHERALLLAMENNLPLFVSPFPDAPIQQKEGTKITTSIHRRNQKKYECGLTKIP